VDLVCLNVSGNITILMITVKTTIENPYEFVKS